MPALSDTCSRLSSLPAIVIYITDRIASWLDRLCWRVAMGVLQLWWVHCSPRKYRDGQTGMAVDADRSWFAHWRIEVLRRLRSLPSKEVVLIARCFTCQQHVSRCQGRTRSDSRTCRFADGEFTDYTCYLTKAHVLLH